MHRLSAVAKGRATIETDVKVEGEPLRFPGGTIDEYRMTTVIELATGKLVELRTKCSWSSDVAGQRLVMRQVGTIAAIAPPAKPGSLPAEPKPGGKD